MAMAQQKYKIKQSNKNTDFKYFNTEDELYEFCKRTKYHFHEIINKYDEMNITFDIDNCLYSIEQIKELVNKIIDKYLEILGERMILIYHRKKGDFDSFHIHTNIKIKRVNLIAIINHFKENNRLYQNILDTQIYTNSLRNIYCEKDNEPNSYFVKPTDVSKDEFLRTIIGYIDKSVESKLKDAVLIEEFMKCSDNTLEACLAEYVEYEQYIDILLEKVFTYERIIGDYDKYYIFCYLMAAISKGSLEVKTRMCAIINEANCKNKTKIKVLDLCFIHYEKFLSNGNLISLLESYVREAQQDDKFNIKPDEIDDICNLNIPAAIGNLNILAQPAGLGKSARMIEFLAKDYNSKFNIFIVPFITNLNDNREKIITIGKSKGQNIHYIEDAFVLNPETQRKELKLDYGKHYLITQGDGHMSLNDLNDLLGGNKNYLTPRKLTIITTADSFRNVAYHIKKYQIKPDLLFVDECYQVLERLANITVENYNCLFNVREMFFKLLKYTKTVFISDIAEVRNMFTIVDRKINNVKFDYGRPHQKYKHIYLGNDKNKYLELISSQRPMFIWATKKKDCKRIKAELISKGVSENDISLVIADIDYSPELLKYKYIISSPKIRSCISIGLDDTHSNRLTIGIHSGNHISPYDFFNSIQRVRKCEELYIFTNSLINNYRIKLKNIYDSQYDEKCIDIINDFTRLGLQDMINTLIKTEDYTFNLDIKAERTFKFDDCEYLVDVATPLQESLEILTKRVKSNKLIDELDEKPEGLYDPLDPMTKYSQAIDILTVKQRELDELKTKEIQIDEIPNYEKEINYLSNHGKIENINLNKVIRLHCIQKQDFINKELNKIKKQLDKDNIIFEGYKYDDKNNYGIINKDNKLLNCNVERFAKAKNIFKKAVEEFNEMNEDDKFKFLLNVVNKRFTPTKLRDAKFKAKILNIIQVTCNDEVYTNLFDINEYVKTLDDPILKQKLIKSKNKLSREVCRELKKRGEKLEYLNYKQIILSNGEIKLEKRNINDYQLILPEINFEKTDFEFLDKKVSSTDKKAVNHWMKKNYLPVIDMKN